VKKRIKFLVSCLAFVFTSCSGQPTGYKIADPSNLSEGCNQEVYGTIQYIRALPNYVCIPQGHIIDDYCRTSDVNQDNFDDFLAVKHNIKQDDQVDGDTTYWDFYERSTKDTLYKKVYTLGNIVPPFVKDFSLEYLTSQPLASKIYELYPFRLSNPSLSFKLVRDSITVSYKMDDTYGKSFVFVYNTASANWVLERIDYFIGELPLYWWQDNEFYSSLSNEIKIIESKVPLFKVSIENFSLISAFKFREMEAAHLAEWHIDKIDQGNHKSVADFDFGQCDQLSLPGDWEY
jgi:hypothetical protein